MKSPIVVICLMGPTGAGKTAASLALAGDFPVTVINADSRQTYRDFPILTARPTPEEEAVCPHRLFGFLPTEEKLGAGEYARLAGAVVAEEHAHGRVPVLVGGTGLYFRALLDGMAEVHHQNIVGDITNDAEIVRNEQISKAEFLLQICKKIENLCLDRDIERRYRLIRHHQLGR